MGKKFIDNININVFQCCAARNLLGEDLGPLNGKELESLERQLDMSLKQIRSTRVHNTPFFFFP